MVCPLTCVSFAIIYKRGKDYKPFFKIRQIKPFKGHLRFFTVDAGRDGFGKKNTHVVFSGFPNFPL